MSSSYKPRSSNEALAEQLSLARAGSGTQPPATPTYRQISGAMATLPRHDNNNHNHNDNSGRIRCDSTATSRTCVYIGGAPNGGGTGNGQISVTLDRRQPQRMSWLNMRRAKANETDLPTVTPSPQTTRSCISTVSSVVDSGGGRTTATSGRISSSGIVTLSGSNNTLSEIQGGYHDMDHDAVSKNFSVSASAHSAHNITTASNAKLLPAAEDESNKQTKCSVFRGLVLCLCLNVSFANVVRFPRELDRYGSAYLLPYVVLLFLVGLPMILLEISVGQFLGQGAAHTWRASPIFKGACIISRFASWLSAIWVSLQAVLALAYIGMFASNELPFRECAGPVKLRLSGYQLTGTSGQECLQQTFLTPFWRNPMYFGLLAAGLIGIWIVVMLCTHNAKILRRSVFVYGLVGLALLCTLTGWEVRNSFSRHYFPELWAFDSSLLAESNIWFNALMQVLFSVNCGFGALPMVTGKFLYKGDAVRTSVVYLCFNLLINAIAVTLFMVQFDVTGNGFQIMEELKPLTAIYDRVLESTGEGDARLLQHLVPSLIYALIILSAMVSITVAVYTSTRLVPRRPNYVICLIGLVVAVISFAAPKFLIARVLDSRLVGTMVVTALVFELIAITWIYGAKNIYTDLEFSVGRPIFKVWMWLWVVCPAILTGILVWWCADDDQYDLLAEYLPRWAPILFVLAVIVVIACVQIFRQVEYNFFGMICEASKPAKEWGPADPLARHSWKQWRSVCQDTGRRDFTLRRRGTRDYTHSIKKGQYSSAAKYGVQNGGGGQTQSPMHQQHWKSSTPGNSSPNYSGSMFGDSAIEEDISVDKFPGITQQQYVPFQASEAKPTRYSQRMRQTAQPQTQTQMRLPRESVEKHREVVYIRRLSDGGSGTGHATRIEISPSNESITYGNGKMANGQSAMSRNPLGRSTGCLAAAAQPPPPSVHVKRSASSVVNVNSHKLPPPTSAGGAADHICWRKFNVNPEEYSTEL
ncbi:sodium- and chloride-dependent neutral and basic amino acid transporter B(0+) isoform X1 [Drosophila ficusphila]|uniref:sodium- and chloride-dependent neutral and basic amino acid transporter B(0+) isoform X1 n=1 Tax=Drosophila ficusphila TaxID=30025 RepID=UPI0007E81469|nr:sodium- and chloride-dependent neutral and basic amino acid transporter B(0+) isoform X1 [Drosophila ficusphila]